MAEKVDYAALKKGGFMRHSAISEIQRHLSFIRAPQSVFTAQISRRRMQEYLRIL